jgi:hypothetical protein
VRRVAHSRTSRRAALDSDPTSGLTVPVQTDHAWRAYSIDTAAHPRARRLRSLKVRDARAADEEAVAGGNTAPHATGQRQATKRPELRLMPVGEHKHVKGRVCDAANAAASPQMATGGHRDRAGRATRLAVGARRDSGLVVVELALDVAGWRAKEVLVHQRGVHGGCSTVRRHCDRRGRKDRQRGGRCEHAAHRSDGTTGLVAIDSTRRDRPVRSALLFAAAALAEIGGVFLKAQE